MAKYRKLSRTSSQRKALLRGQVTALLNNGKIVTTEAKAKEVRKIAEGLIAMAVREKDNFETVEVKVVKAKLDSKGNKEMEKVTSKNGKEYLRVVKEEKMEQRQKDMPSRLNARRKIMAKTNKVKDSKGNNIDLPAKLFGELATKYATRQGGYTRIIKVGPRRGDNAERAIIELV